MQDEKSQFRKDVIILVVDKLVIGILLICIGIFAKQLVENYKSSLSFSTELNKVRVQKIAEVWGQLKSYENKNKNLYNEILNQMSSGNVNVDGLKKKFKTELDYNYHKTLNILSTNVFWLGNDVHSKLEEYT